MNKMLRGISLAIVAVGSAAIVSSCGTTTSTANLTVKGAGSASTSARLAAVDLQASNPAALKLKIYKVAFSTSALCTNLQTVYTKTESEATYSDFLLNPSIVQNGSLADGTYKCVVIEFSSIIKPTTTATDGSCTAATEFSLDVCGSQGGNTTTSTLIDGTTTTCTAGDDHIAMYLSTGSTQTNGTEGHNAFQAPTSESDALHGFKLTNPFVKAGAVTGTFVVNGAGKINGDGASCEMQPPLFSFQ